MKETFPYSRIIAGTMTWGRWGKGLSVDGMEALIHHCIELGITTFDHADIYGDYTTEKTFGSAFANSGVSREDIQVISKCGIQMKGTARKNPLKYYDYSKDYIIKSVDGSLQKLQTDYLDLLLLHRPSPLMQPDEVAEAISSLLKAGKIKTFGVSNFTPSQIGLLEKEVAVMANQVEFSLTSHNCMYDGTLDDAMAHGRALMAWSPLGSFFRIPNQQTDRIKKVMEPLMERYNAEADQLLLAWLLKHPAKVFPVVGTTNPKRLKKAMETLNIPLDDKDWFALLAASQGQEVP